MTKPFRRGPAADPPGPLKRRGVSPRPRLGGQPVEQKGSLAERVADWIAEDERLTAMQREWQACERIVFDKAKQLKMSCELACLSDWPEARTMRALDSRIVETRRRLDASARRIHLTRVSTLADALAKIELGLKVQGPFDWRENALDLLQDGLADLREITASTRL